jgi:tRNA nucleotidyltransferase/poly(A) polymerase
VTTFRKDVETFGRKASVQFAETLVEDLSRRDFTINAVAWHPLTDRVQDPFGGIQDLRDGVLRTVGDPRARFSEDFLRVLRGLRFSGRFRLAIERATWQALRSSTIHLDILSRERVREELMKVLAEDPTPSRALSLYRISGALEILYPEVLSAQSSRRAGARDDLWTRALLLTDALPRNRPLLRLTSFLGTAGPPEEAGEDVGAAKEGSTAGDGPSLQMERIAALMIRLRFSNAEIRTVTSLVRGGLEAPLWLTEGSNLREWLYRSGPEQLPSLARIWIAAARLDRLRWGLSPERLLGLIKCLRVEARSGAPLRLQDLALDGRDLISLGMRPGPRFREVLEMLMQRVLKDPDLNRREILEEIANRWMEEMEDEGR